MARRSSNAQRRRSSWWYKRLLAREREEREARSVRDWYCIEQRSLGLRFYWWLNVHYRRQVYYQRWTMVPLCQCTTSLSSWAGGTNPCWQRSGKSARALRPGLIPH